jgi:predicted dinucleotide-binding enzyme
LTTTALVGAGALLAACGAGGAGAPGTQPAKKITGTLTYWPEGGETNASYKAWVARIDDFQKAYPDAKVVKTLNTVNAGLMVAPGSISEPHSVFVCGNDDEAKAQVRDLLVSFGWPAEDVLDLGDITGARGTEMYLPLWLRLASATGSWMVNVKVVKPEG